MRSLLSADSSWLNTARRAPQRYSVPDRGQFHCHTSLPQPASPRDANKVLVGLRELEAGADAGTVLLPRCGTSRSVVAEECARPPDVAITLAIAASSGWPKLSPLVEIRNLWESISASIAVDRLALLGARWGIAWAGRSRSRPQFMAQHSTEHMLRRRMRSATYPAGDPAAGAVLTA